MDWDQVRAECNRSDWLKEVAKLVESAEEFSGVGASAARSASRRAVARLKDTPPGFWIAEYTRGVQCSDPPVQGQPSEKPSEKPSEEPSEQP